MNQADILICSAIEKELNLFNKNKFNTLILGVGNIASAYSLTNYLSENKSIKKVFFLGSCGLYLENYKKYQFGISSHFLTKEFSVVNGKAKQPDRMKTEINFLSNIKIKDFLIGKTNSISYITTKDLYKSEIEYFKSNEILFENMETFGLAYVCESKKIDFTAFYSITNLVGKDGSKDWEKNYEFLALKLQEHLLKVEKCL